MHCRSCGKGMADEAVVCVSCGVPSDKGSFFVGIVGDQPILRLSCVLNAELVRITGPEQKI